MSGLNKPTIEGLIEKLLSDNYIKPDEAETVQSMLQSATSGMTTEEISILIGSLNDKVEAPSSELLTQDGINLSVLESAINETTKVIIREKIERENNQKENVPIENARTREEIEELKRQEAIKETKEFFKSNSFLAGLNMTKDEMEKFAQIKNDPKVNEYAELKNQHIKNGLSEDEAHQKAQKQTRIKRNKRRN